MTACFRRNLLIIAAAHVAVLVGVCVFDWIRGLIPDAPQEITTYVELQTIPPVPDLQQKASPPPRDPAPSPPSEVTTPIEPPKKTRDRKPINVSKRRIQREGVTPPQPVPRQQMLRKEIAKKLYSAELASPPNRQDDFPFDWYFALVRRAMYEVWDQPSAASARLGVITKVSIRVHRDGTISFPKIIQSSGDMEMDDSVLRAVHSVHRLKELPRQYKGDYKDITVDFILTRTN